MIPKISIVMPVYNVEKYLRECLDSVRAQTFTDWECICVDDGSTDASPAILDEYAANDFRFRIFRREHSNAGAVRNFGMGKATGDYLAFLDSDDVFSPWMFETLLDKAEETGADVVASGQGLWFADGTPRPVFQQPGDLKWIDRTPDPDWTTYPLCAGTMPWNKIVKRSFVLDNELRYLEQTSTNDLTFNALCLSLSKTSVETPSPFVAYRKRKSSIQSKKGRHPENFVQAVLTLLDGLRSRGVWQTLSESGRARFFGHFAWCAVWELETQTTPAGYRRLYRALPDFARQIPPALFGSRSDFGNAPNHNRFAEIAAGGRKERIRARLEQVLAPVLGTWSRYPDHSRRARAARKVRRLFAKIFG